MADEEKEVWTTGSDNNGNEAPTLSRVSTASASAKAGPIKNEHNQYLVGVDSKFKRKYFHKTLFAVGLTVIIILIIVIIILSVYHNYNAPCDSKDCLRAAANLLQSMDKTIDPCEDFYMFSCGNWADEHPKPDSSSSYDWFSEKQNKVLRNIRHFLQSNITDNDPDAVKQTKIMYKACMDTESMNKLGIKVITKYLTEFSLPQFPSILNVTTNKNYKFNWIKSVAMIKQLFEADLIIGFDIFPDPLNRSINRIAIGAPESGTLLPFKNSFDMRMLKIQRKVLLNSEDNDEDDDDDEEKSEESSDEDEIDDSRPIKAYRRYMSKVISFMITSLEPSVDLEKALPNIKAASKVAVDITKIIYKFTEEAENVSSKNPENPLDDIISFRLADFQNVTDQLISPKTLPIWKQYLKTVFAHIPELTLKSNEIILTSKGDLQYIQNIIEFISTTSENDIELYVWWSIVDELILHTVKEIRDLHNEYAKELTKLESSTPRSLYCTGGVNSLMGMAVSYAIAEPTFLTNTKPMVDTMLNNIREAFNNLVRQTTWMDKETKCSTLQKSVAMQSLIGFPDWILDRKKLDLFYNGIQLNATKHLDNMMTVIRWQMRERLKTLRKVEKFGWATTPTNVNAFHVFQANAITVPLAILQYPFYNLGLEALNYGAIGSILGHELTHGFDDSGRMFDKEGNMRQWWSNQTIVEYINRTTCFIKQYGDYYLPEVKDYINGELTLGENIADNGGLREAFYAYQLYVRDFGEETKLVGFEEYTHNQLFFISYGNLWCETQTPKSYKWAIEDSHCPGKIRLKGVLSNSPEFSDAFGCKPNSGMYPKNRCRIW